MFSTRFERDEKGLFGNSGHLYLNAILSLEQKKTKAYYRLVTNFACGAALDMADRRPVKRTGDTMFGSDSK